MRPSDVKKIKEMATSYGGQCKELLFKWSPTFKPEHVDELIEVGGALGGCRL